MAFEALKDRQAAAYSNSKFELLAETAADIHDDLVERLGVRAGERWLDLATGTGAVAVRAARRGAVVTGQDLAEGLIQTAQRLAAQDGVDVTFEVGDCEQLPYPDGSFDVISSAQGAVFAPDHRAVARELERVSAPGGRIAWQRGARVARSAASLRRWLRFSPRRRKARGCRSSGGGRSTCRSYWGMSSSSSSTKASHLKWRIPPRQCGICS